MALPKSEKSVSRIKTGSFERKLSLTKAGLFVGTRMATHMAANMFVGKERRVARRKKMLSRQAEFLVGELGKLKGSVVKIGQVMALYGEHFLPVEVTEALHTLEDHTVALDWPVIKEVLELELSLARLSELDIDPVPIGAASLGQVHLATRRSDGHKICLKIQYPGVADAVDSDLESVAQLLRLARLVSIGPDFNEWLEEVRQMMQREVNYRLEARTTIRFREMLKDDDRYIVPEVFPEYSTDHIIATEYEEGISINSPQLAKISQERRNYLAKTSLELFLKELFLWKEAQTDPNFGNYLIRLAKTEEGDSNQKDKLVLLDFGAVQTYPDSFIKPVCDIIVAAYDRNLEEVIDGCIALNIMHAEWPRKILKEFGEVCMDVMEPMAREDVHPPDYTLNAKGEYRWKYSDLPTRVAKRVTLSAVNRYFKIPPKEFVFLNRKLVGVYTFIAVLDAEFNGRDLLKKYIDAYR